MAIKSVFKRTKPKTPNPSTKQPAEASRKAELTTLEEDVYVNMKSLTLWPVSEAYLCTIAREMIDFVEDEEIGAVRLSQFLRKKGMDWDDMQRFMKRCPDLRRAHKWYLMVCAERREIGMMGGKFKEHSTMFMMPHYDADWKAMNEWREQIRAEAKFKAEGNTTKQDVNVYLNGIPMPKKDTK